MDSHPRRLTCANPKCKRRFETRKRGVFYCPPCRRDGELNADAIDTNRRQPELPELWRR